MSYAETIGRVMQGDYANASEDEKLWAVRDVTTVSAVAAAAAAVQPIPFVDMALLAPIHVGMVQAIGQVHGYELDAKTVLEVLASFGASIVARGVVMSALKVVPVFGWVASASMAYATTYAIGEVSHAYFKSGRGLSGVQLKSMFKAAYAQKKNEREAAARAQDTLQERLRQLTHAYEAGFLNEEEYRRKKEEILASL